MSTVTGIPEAEKTPTLSVVVIAYNMGRELPRTLYTLSSAYQRGIASDEYEIIVVDNGSAIPVDPDIGRHAGFSGSSLRVIRVQDPSASPAAALNLGIAAARGQYVGSMVDGARMCSPGMLGQTLGALRALSDAVVCTLGWYLGYDYQRLAMAYGYDQVQEDALLDSVDWREDGYRLFEISAMDESSVDGWHKGFSESNAIFMSKNHWQSLGGFDERFDLPGGGLVNLDLCKRALEELHAPCVLLLGEATFHQVHGGTATNTAPQQLQADWLNWSAQYEQIRGKPWANPVPRQPLLYWGSLPASIQTLYLRGLIFSSSADATPMAGDLLAGRAMPDDVWQPDRLTAAQHHIYKAFRHALQAQLYGWVAKACRILRRHDPQWRAPQHLLRLVGPWLPQNEGLNRAENALLDTFEAWVKGGIGAPLPDLVSPELLTPVQARERTIQELEQKLANTNQALVHKTAELDAVLSSRSWRLTEPLRRLRGGGRIS